jgi:dTDP-4-dehydrorhamnose reductase
MSEPEIDLAIVEPEPPKRILVLGGSGMLGSDVAAEFTSRGHYVEAPSSKERDISNPDHLESLRRRDWGNLNWVVNCAAFTDVDGAEEDRWQAQRINGTAPGVLAYMCAKNDWRFMHISTDFVFDGTHDVPIPEEASTNPIGAYGQTKFAGEKNALKENPDSIIVRTAWLYGPNGKSFPRTMIKAWLAGKDLRVVNDQIGTPSYTADLARVLGDMIESDVDGGIWHAAGSDVMSWHEFATQVNAAYGACCDDTVSSPEITAVSTEEWPTPARRPKYSALSSEKLKNAGITPMRPTTGALVDFVSRLPRDL